MSAQGIRPVEVHGYAIISDDNMIAADDGLVPLTLRNEKDWEYYQGALARSDLVVFGHTSHIAEPNTRGGPRLVITRHAADGLEQRPDAWFWDPARVAWSAVVARLLPSGGNVAAPGGQGVFDLFLGIGYDAFHLSRAAGVKLPGGRPVFSACATGLSAEDVLAKAGLVVGEHIPLDPAHGVEMNVWRRPKG